MAHDFANMVADLLGTDAFGQAATITEPDGSPAAVTVAFSEPEPDLLSNDTGQANERRAFALVGVADWTTPVRWSTLKLTATDEEWTVRSWRQVGTAGWRLELTRAEPVERSHGVRNRR